MELEALRTEFTNALGSTKLNFSEQTIDGFLQDALAELGEATELPEGFIERKVNLAKTFMGQINHDVKTRVDDFKKNYKPEPKQDPKPEDDNSNMPEWFKLYKSEQEKKISELEAENKNSRIKAYREDVEKRVREGLLSKFNKASVEVNNYILKQTLRDADIPDEDADVDSIIKTMEKSYYTNLKDAGLFTDSPRRSTSGGGNSKNSVDDYFKKKREREKWNK